MKLSKKNLKNLEFIAMVFSLIGVMLVISEVFYSFGVILSGIGFIVLIITVRYLNSFPLNEVEIVEVKATHKKGKSYYITNALYYGLSILFVHIIVEVIKSFWFDTPLFKSFGFTDIVFYLTLFLVIPIIAGYTIWKTNEETYQQLAAKND